MAMLEVRNLTRLFGGLAAVKGVSLELHQGELVGLIGPNGDGKTTLFNVVNGFYPPSHGEVFFKGQKISHFKPHKICNRGIARTFQNIRLFQNMTALENVMVGRHTRTAEGPVGAVFYMMTGMHAFHVLTGLIFLAVVWVNGRKGLYDEKSYPVEAAAVYWHFVDVVWIFFYPALYLIGAAIL